MQFKVKGNKEHLFICIVFLCGVMIVGLYSFFDPVEYGQYFPFCPVKKITGLDCPSCGNQRAFHALLSGEIIVAIKYNFFLIFTILYFIGIFIGELFKYRDRRFYLFFLGKKGALTYLYAYIFWFIIRNIIRY